MVGWAVGRHGPRYALVTPPAGRRSRSSSLPRLTFIHNHTINQLIKFPWLGYHQVIFSKLKPFIQIEKTLKILDSPPRRRTCCQWRERWGGPCPARSSPRCWAAASAAPAASHPSLQPFQPASHQPAPEKRAAVQYRQLVNTWTLTNTCLSILKHWQILVFQYLNIDKSFTSLSILEQRQILVYSYLQHWPSIPSNALSSAMDLNFDRFFLAIISQGWKVSDRHSVKKLTAVTVILNHGKKLYRCTYMFWYNLQKFCLFNKKVSMLGIAKSFCVSEFGKLEVTSTPEESSFFRALALLKL